MCVCVCVYAGMKERRTETQMPNIFLQSCVVCDDCLQHSMACLLFLSSLEVLKTINICYVFLLPIYNHSPINSYGRYIAPIRVDDITHVHYANATETYSRIALLQQPDEIPIYLL